MQFVPKHSLDWSRANCWFNWFKRKWRFVLINKLSLVLVVWKCCYFKNGWRKHYINQNWEPTVLLGTFTFPRKRLLSKNPMRRPKLTINWSCLCSQSLIQHHCCPKTIITMNMGNVVNFVSISHTQSSWWKYSLEKPNVDSSANENSPQQIEKKNITYLLWFVFGILPSAVETGGFH